MSRKHMGVGLIGVANKNAVFAALVVHDSLANDSKQNEANFLMISTD
jgi:ribose 5-phosphate isomerase RpiB